MAAVVIVLLMFSLALMVASAQERVVATLRANLELVKRWGAWILILVGTWMIGLTVLAHYFADIFPV